MWKCEKCEREFMNTNQSHFCNNQITVIDEYIASQSEETKSYLHQIRDTIRNVLPDAEEKISWRMPTYKKTHNIIHFAAFKNHIGIYPGVEAMIHFADKLKEYKTSKGALQIPYNKPLPLELIAEIAKWCDETGNHP